MVHANSFKRPVNSTIPQKVRGPGISVLLCELLVFALFLALSGCGAPPEDTGYGSYISYDYSAYYDAERVRQAELERVAAERAREQSEEARLAREASKAQRAKFETAASTAGELTDQPLPIAKLEAEPEISRAELTAAAQKSEGYYIKGRRQSEGLTDISQAQVVFVGNRHWVQGDSPVAFRTNLESKHYFAESAAQRAEDNLLFSDNSVFPENILLVEGYPEQLEVDLKETEYLTERFTERELTDNVENRIREVRGWDSVFAMQYLLEVNELVAAGKTVQPWTLDSNYHSNYTSKVSEFFVLQLRNYFMFQSIVKTLRTNPQARIIVTAGTCHFTCDESLFALLKQTNIRYTTLESEDSVVKDIPPLILDVRDIWKSYIQGTTQGAVIEKSLRQHRAQLLRTFFERATERTVPDFFSHDSLQVRAIRGMIREAAIDALKLRDHIEYFFFNGAYTLPESED